MIGTEHGQQSRVTLHKPEPDWIVFSFDRGEREGDCFSFPYVMGEAGGKEAGKK